MCFTCSTTSLGAEEQAADPAERLREASRRRWARAPGGPCASSDAAAVRAERAGAVRVVEDERPRRSDRRSRRTRAGAPCRRRASRRPRTTTSAFLRSRVFRMRSRLLAELWLKKRTSGAVPGHAGGEERAVEDAGVAVRVEDERRVLVGERHDRAEHRLVAGRERQALLEAEPLREALLELDVLGRRRLRTRRAREAARVLVDRALGRLLDLRVVGQAEVVVRAEVDDRLAADRACAARRCSNSRKYG